MGPSVYFRRDIANVLRSLACVEMGQETDDQLAQYGQGYRDGFQVALVAIGLAFGLEPVSKANWGQTQPLAKLLWVEVVKE